MRKNYVVGVDIGTQGTKAAVFRDEGSREGEAFEASRLIRRGTGTVWQEPDEIYGSVLRTIRKAVENSKVSPADIHAVGMDGQMAGIMAVDCEFEAVGAYDSWLDTRCEPYISQMKAQAEEEIIRKTGGPVTYTHGPKILYRKQECPEEYKKIAKFVLPGVYAAGKMCGLKAEEAWVDYTHLHFSGFADNRKKEWDKGLLEEFQISSEKLPRIENPWTVVGRLTEPAARECGLLPGTAVVAGCGDSAASALGAGIVKKDMIYDVAGTASIFSCSTEQFTPDLKHKTLLFSRSVIDGLYTPLAYIGGGGMCLPWFIKQYGGTYGEWNEKATAILAGSQGLYFVPHFSGRTCPNDPGMRGAFWGMDFIHTPAHMYRSILEGIAYEYSCYYRILKEQNPQISPSCIYGAGGGAKSEIFCQIKA
ncbi:MAG TPA: hypothetical protein IAA63_10940, partial [Candidatus Pullilachnospira stercoravium]|nr:hypothetical protein [Candidatus Pullilachnospira stercoravium]